MAGVLHVLLDLALLPTGGGRTKLRLEQVVTDHCRKAGVDIPCLAGLRAIHGRLHIVVNATSRDTPAHGKGMLECIEQHLVRLQGIGAQQERPTMAQLELSDLQLGAFATQYRKIFALVELKRLARSE